MKLAVNLHWKQMNAHVHIQLPIGAKFTGLCPQNDKSTRFNIILLFNTQYLTLALQAMHTVHDQIFWYAKQVLLNTSAYCRYRGS